MVSFKYYWSVDDIITFQEGSSFELRTNLTMGFDLFVSMRIYCPHCKRTVEVIPTPEYYWRKGEVRYICPRCGRRI
jgi:transposase-like protein